MHLLFASNLYPPHAIGGYEQLCMEVAEAFVDRGHEVNVLTARQDGPSHETLNGVSIHRALHREVEGGMLQTTWRLAAARAGTEKENVAVTTQLLEQVKPDAALIWGMWNIPRSVPATIENLLPDKTAYYFLDYWPSLPNAYIQRLQEPARRSLAAIPKRLAAAVWLPGLQQELTPDLAFAHAACVSRAVRDTLTEKDIPIEDANVIHLGIKSEDILTPLALEDRATGESLSIVYAGRLTADKGVHTAIEAIKIFRDSGFDDVTLDVYGTGDSDYELHLRRLVDEGRLPVKFLGQVSRERLLKRLPSYDVMVFPSIWQEPFSHTVLEGMAAGLTVVGTTTGGTGEVLVDRETGLTFEPGNAKQLAEKLTTLARDGVLRSKISTRGRDKVLSEFTFTRTVERLELFLEGIVDGSSEWQSASRLGLSEQPTDTI